MLKQGIMIYREYMLKSLSMSYPQNSLWDRVIYFLILHHTAIPSKQKIVSPLQCVRLEGGGCSNTFGNSMLFFRMTGKKISYKGALNSGNTNLSKKETRPVKLTFSLKMSHTNNIHNIILQYQLKFFQSHQNIYCWNILLLLDNITRISADR